MSGRERKEREPASFRSSNVIHHSAPLDPSEEEKEHKHDTYSERQERVTQKQLELQEKIAKRERQIKSLLDNAKMRAHTRNQKLFLEFLRTLATQYHELANQNHQVASLEEVEHNRKKLSKLIWFDELDKVPDDEGEEEAEERGEGLFGNLWSYARHKIWPRVKRLLGNDTDDDTLSQSGGDLMDKKKELRRRFH